MRGQMNNPYGVRVGQIWQDWDGRFRTVTPVYKKILEIKGKFAYCEGIRNGVVISRTNIALKRFKSNSTGYLLIEEPKRINTCCKKFIIGWKYYSRSIYICTCLIKRKLLSYIVYSKVAEIFRRWAQANPLKTPWF